MTKSFFNVKSKIRCNEAIGNAQSIEEKMREVTQAGNSIDITSVPPIYTDKADGVLAGLDIRTDRFDVALEARDKISAMIIAKREAAKQTNETNNITA